MNMTTGTITGTFTGASSTVTYQITGSNSFGSIASTFVLNYKPQSDANIQGLSACYYAGASWSTGLGESWFLDNVAEVCTLVESLDLEDEYEDEEHTWPGLDDRFERTFSAGITGYLNIGVAGEYTFTLLSSQVGALYFDDQSTPVISFSGNNQQEKNGIRR